MMDERHDSPAEQERWIREAIRSTADVRADAAFRERLKREFVSGTLAASAPERTETRRRTFPFWTWLLVPAAAVALVVVLLLPGPEPEWSVQALRGEGSLEIDGRLVASADRGELARALAGGARIRVPESASLDLRLDDRLVLELDAGADVALPVPPRSDGQDPLISVVHDGELKIKTGPGFPGSEMHILTDDGRTEIVGTIVSVYRGDGYTCVCVLEGTALIGEDEASLEEVQQGKLKVMFTDGSPSIVAGISREHEEGLIDFSERYRDLFEPPE